MFVRPSLRTSSGCGPISGARTTLNALEDVAHHCASTSGGRGLDLGPPVRPARCRRRRFQWYFFFCFEPVSRTIPSTKSQRAVRQGGTMQHAATIRAISVPLVGTGVPRLRTLLALTRHPPGPPDPARSTRIDRRHAARRGAEWSCFTGTENDARAEAGPASRPWNLRTSSSPLDDGELLALFRPFWASNPSVASSAGLGVESFPAAFGGGRVFVSLGFAHLGPPFLPLLTPSTTERQERPALPRATVLGREIVHPINVESGTNFVTSRRSCLLPSSTARQARRAPGAPPSIRFRKKKRIVFRAVGR